MSEMIERVARALCGPDADKMVNGIVVTDFGQMGFSASLSGPLEPMWHGYREKARVAVEAMLDDPDDEAKAGRLRAKWVRASGVPKPSAYAPSEEWAWYLRTLSVNEAGDEIDRMRSEYAESYADYD